MATDIVLNGAGYMLEPATYERTQDGIADGRTGRVQQNDWFGGQLRVVQLERDMTWKGLGVGPMHGGQGVGPWPRSALASLDPAQRQPDPTLPVPWVAGRNRIYFALGGEVFQTHTFGSAGFLQPDLVHDYDVEITDMCWYNNDILVGFGNARDLEVLSPGTGSSVLLAGEKGFSVAGYSGFAVWAQASSQGPTNEIRMVTGSGVESRYLDHHVLRLETAGAKLYAITRNALYTFTGRVRETMVPNPAWVAGSTEPTQVPALRWSGEWTPFFQHGTASRDDDYQFVLSFGGKLYAWLNGEVLEHQPSSDRAGWRATGLTGRTCSGACVAGGWLVVTIQTDRGNSEVWGWDGTGWWRLLESIGGGYMRPIPVLDVGQWDCLVLHDNEHEATLLRLYWRDDANTTLPPEAFCQSAMIHAGAADRRKAWRKIGCTFGSPESQGVLGSTDDVGVILEYSMDGEVWYEAVRHTFTEHTRDQLNHPLSAEIASSWAVSNYLMIRVRWEGISNWAPILTNWWVEHELIESPARRRRWTFAVTARDQTVDRDGVLLQRTGHALIGELWSAWEQGDTMPFRDLDYAQRPTERNVRIVGISEKVTHPDTVGDFGDSAVKLTLVEV